MLYCAWRWGGEDPYRLYNIKLLPDIPPCPNPQRLKYFIYAMAEYARDEDLRIHSVHPDQHKDTPKQPEGTEIRMPGGTVGTK